LFFPKQKGRNDFLIPAFALKSSTRRSDAKTDQPSTLNRPRGQYGEQTLLGLREDRCLRVARRANKYCLADVRLISHLPGEPVEAGVNPVQAFVVTVRSLVLILKNFTVFHAASIGWPRRFRYGVFSLIRVLLLSATAPNGPVPDQQPSAFISG
jgi:hypothetical protein